LVGLLIFLALILVGGGGLFYYTGVYQPQQKSLQLTATAQAQANSSTNATATANAGVKATEQAQVNATGTAQAGAVSTVAALNQLYTQSTSGTPALNEPMSANTASNWDDVPGCSFTNKAYHVSVDQKNLFLYCTAHATNFSNFAYQVQMNILKGDGGGLIFRADTDAPHYYVFTIKASGTFGLYYYPDDTATNAKTLATGTNKAIKSGVNQTNTFTVIAKGSTISIYANSEFLTQATESSLSSGQIGLIALESTNATEVAYSQLKVWKL
jgi:hypothetical protein